MQTRGVAVDAERTPPNPAPLSNPLAPARAPRLFWGLSFEVGAVKMKALELVLPRPYFHALPSQVYDCSR